MPYDKARSDFEYLETIAILDDQVELDARRLELMQNPSKATACDMYESGIRLWFKEHGIKWSNSRVLAIAEHYNPEI